MARLPKKMTWLFWEMDLRSLDTERDADYILARVLEHGCMEEVRWVIKRYGLQRIHRFFREVGDPEISDRTTAFWRAVFKAKDERWAKPSKLAKDQQAALGLLNRVPALQRFYLAGGSAIASHLGHRLSLDLDLFSLDRSVDLQEVKGPKPAEPTCDATGPRRASCTTCPAR